MCIIVPILELFPKLFPELFPNKTMNNDDRLHPETNMNYRKPCVIIKRYFDL